ncbi:S8 family peptidase [Corynebacterium kroppenstedtii]|uniref:S8 family peptidase n=1 Tax=Corynebacterium sp. PCR 32 TaxID=3351342 RepID=UPI00309E3459
MKKYRNFAASTVAVLSVAIAASSLLLPALNSNAEPDHSADSPRSRNHVRYDLDADQFIVTFNKMATVDEKHRMDVINEITSEFKSKGSYTRQMFDGSYVVKLDPPVPARDVPSLKGKLESKAEINVAEIDQIQKNSATPSDSDFGRQWSFTHEHGSHIPPAWDAGARGQNQVIAVVDTGITPHPDLEGKILPGYDMISEDQASRDRDPGRDANPNDEGDWTRPGMCRADDNGGPSSWHGTHVAGIAAANTDNGQGVAGVAPDARILPVRALGACGGRLSDIVDGIAWSAGKHIDGVPDNPNKANVINLSLGGDAPRCSAPYQRAIDFANEQGATVAVAAGNDNTDTSYTQPANCKGVMVVGATGPEGHRANYSNYGDAVDFGAPGGNHLPRGRHGGVVNEEAGIWSTVNKGETGQTEPGYRYLDGTSMATPLVAGVIALIKSAKPGITNPEIEKILRNTASPYTQEPDDNYGNSSSKTHQLGAGIVNARAAVCAAQGRNEHECGGAEEPREPAPGDEARSRR